ncbi:uncharacterized protein LOC111126537 isoform X1 [Crassostrea virginica]
MMIMNLCLTWISIYLGLQVGVEAVTTDSSVFTVNAYYSYKRIVDFIISFSNSTWLEAEGTCQAMNGTLWGEDKLDLLLYLRILAHQKISWPSDRHIWLNRVREANTTQWTNDVECESGASITQPVHRNNNNVTQCLALNMTSPEDEEYVLFAESCDEQMSFVCIQFKGYFSENKGYDILPAYIVDKPNNTVTMFNASSEVCLEHLFWNFTCYAAEYNVKFLECLLFCTPLLLLPESIQLQWSPGNLTTVVKTSSNINILTYNAEDKVIGHFPCEDMALNITNVTHIFSNLSTMTQMDELTSQSTVNVPSETINDYTQKSDTIQVSYTEVYTEENIANISMTSTAEQTSSVNAITNNINTVQLGENTSELSANTTELSESTTELSENTELSGTPTVSTRTQDTNGILIISEESTQKEIVTSLEITSVEVNTSTPTTEITKTIGVTTHSPSTRDDSNSASTTMHDERTVAANTVSEATLSGSTSRTTTSTACAPCLCNMTAMNKTDEQIQKEIEEIKSYLIIEKSTLSSYTRQKYSAPDSRWSSTALGSVGILVITVVSVLIVLSDIQYLSRALKAWKKRLRADRSPKPEASGNAENSSFPEI